MSASLESAHFSDKCSSWTDHKASFLAGENPKFPRLEFLWWPGVLGLHADNNFKVETSTLVLNYCNIVKWFFFVSKALES